MRHEGSGGPSATSSEPPRCSAALEPAERRVLLGRPQRFGEIREAIPGISDHLLSERLKQLEAEGILRREVTDGRPVLIEYSLTPAGADLHGAIGAIGAWAERWTTAEGVAQSRSAAGGRSR
jgi:DNA-binding HxlR family transcriptional regulator